MQWMYAQEEHLVSDRPLDPIDRATVGRLHIVQAARSALALGLRVIGLILSTVVEPDEPTWLRHFTTNPTGPPINGRYAAHISELIDCGLVRPCERSEVKLVSGYFEVQKGDKARAIFNGKRLSAACPTPPNVNLTTHHRIVQEVAEGRMLITTVDLRHWFHQIPVSATTRKLFGLRRIGELFLQWVCLPMGWSFSPAIAQAASWMLVLHRGVGEKELFDVEKLRTEGASLPAWVYSRTRKTAVTIYYDNIVIVSGERSELNKIVSRIRSNMNIFQAELKFSKRKEQGKPNPTAEEMKQATDEEWRFVDLKSGATATVLGMTLTYSRGLLIVRPRKLQEWLDTTVPADCTVRVAAEFCGKLVFAAQLRDACLYGTAFGREVAHVASRIGHIAHQSGWEKTLPDSALHNKLGQLWQQLEARCSEPVEIKRLLGRRSAEWILVTDAPESGWGIVVYRANVSNSEVLIRTKVYEQGGRFSKMDTRHIFYKELEAVLRGLKWMHEKADDKNVIVAVDNTAVAWALRHGASKSEAAMVMLERSCLGQVPVADVVSVASADNPADPASRGDAYEKDREERMVFALKMHFAGLMWASERNKHSNRGGIRHEEPTDGDDVWLPKFEDASEEEENQSSKKKVRAEQ